MKKGCYWLLSMGWNLLYDNILFHLFFIVRIRKTSKFPKILKNCHEAIRKDFGNAFFPMPQRKVWLIAFVTIYNL